MLLITAQLDDLAQVWVQDVFWLVHSRSGQLSGLGSSPGVSDVTGALQLLCEGWCTAALIMLLMSSGCTIRPGIVVWELWR